MKYLQVTVTTTEEGIEELTGLLLVHDIMETVVENPGTAREVLNKKNDYEWDYVEESCFNTDYDPKISFYLDDDKSGQNKLEEIKDALKVLLSEDENNMLGSLEVNVDVIDDEDWMNSYKDHFKTIQLTDNIIVKPSWEEIPEGNTKKVLELDPGMAFGTGDHATTSLCAQLMDKAGCEGKDILDVGTGSGILAICADLLGGKEILGIDIDPIAVEVAKENGKYNNCGSNVKFKVGDLTKGTDFKADIVVANLMAEIVIMLAGAVKKHMKPGAIFISSGILLEKKKKVTDAFEELGLSVVEVLDKGEWSAIVAKVNE